MESIKIKSFYYKNKQNRVSLELHRHLSYCIKKYSKSKQFILFQINSRPKIDKEL